MALQTDVEDPHVLRTGSCDPLTFLRCSLGGISVLTFTPPAPLVFLSPNFLFLRTRCVGFQTTLMPNFGTNLVMFWKFQEWQGWGACSSAMVFGPHSSKCWFISYYIGHYWMISWSWQETDPFILLHCIYQSRSEGLRGFLDKPQEPGMHLSVDRIAWVLVHLIVMTLFLMVLCMCIK